METEKSCSAAPPKWFLRVSGNNSQPERSGEMSFVIAVYVPEGIGMASDSRQSVNIEGKNPEGKTFKVETVNSDAIIKTHLLEKHQIGISNFGQDLMGGVPIASHIKRFIEEELTPRDDVTSVPRKLVDSFRKSFATADAGFH